MKTKEIVKQQNKMRELYDAPNADKSSFKSAPGISKAVVLEISKQKNEPEWMLEKRLKSLAYFEKTSIPTWGPDLSSLHLDEIIYFVRPGAEEVRKWEDVPADIKKTFEKLGIPEAEKKALAGVGAQYDSDVVYHNIKEELKQKGVIFENMDVALQKYPDLVKKYFMTSCVPINDHKFVMLHGAVWSGGTFIYVPKNVKVDLPLQAYFRMNAESGGQFEHTLIIADEGSELEYIEGCSAPRYSKNSLHAGCVEIFVGKNAKVKYYSIENWSKNTFNLNTKRAIVDEDGSIEWVSGNMGSGTTMLYPCSVLRGRGAHSDNLGIAFAGQGQYQDVGAKSIHAAPFTSSRIRSRSISAQGGVTGFRGLIKVTKKAVGTTASMSCDALLLDEESSSNASPSLQIDTNDVSVAHEARIGKIGDEQLFYLMSRGLTEEQALRLIVTGFIEPISRSLPLEYTIELQKLIEMEMEGAVG